MDTRKHPASNFDTTSCESELIMAQNSSDSPLPHPAAVPDSNPTKNLADLQGARVLVVDDEPDVRRLVSIVLRYAGAIVEVAKSKQEALQLLEGNSFDAIVSDISMPGGDGLSLLEEVRQRGCDTPTIALSALPWPDVQARVQQAGFALHLEKPAEISMLTEAVADVIESGKGN